VSSGDERRATVGDTVTKRITKSLTEAITAGDSIATPTTTVSAQTEDSTVTDVITKTITKSLTEAITAGDNINTPTTTVSAQTEDSTVTDVITKTITKSLTEAITAGDSVVTIQETGELSPTSNGTPMDWSVSDGAGPNTCATQFDCVNDPPGFANHDGDDTAITSTTTGDIARFGIGAPNIPIPSGATITSVVLHTIVRDTGGNNRIILGVISDSFYNDTASAQLGTSYTEETFDVTGLEAWVPADFNSQLVDISVESAPAGQTIFVTHRDAQRNTHSERETKTQ